MSTLCVCTRMCTEVGKSRSKIIINNNTRRTVLQILIDMDNTKNEILTEMLHFSRSTEMVLPFNRYLACWA